jgi:hypothetical protein
MHLSAHQLGQALTPTAYTGASSDFVDRVLTAVEHAPAAET